MSTTKGERMPTPSEDLAAAILMSHNSQISSELMYEHEAESTAATLIAEGWHRECAPALDMKETK